MIRPVARFGRDRRGAAMVEFAFIAPLLILFYVGMAELCQGLMAERKASHAASAMADLVAQSDEITPADIGGVLNIADEIVRPFPGGENLKIRVMSVLVDANNVPKVQWCENRHWDDYSKDTVVTLPKVSDGNGGQKNFVAAGESVILTNVHYSFATPFSDLFTAVQKLARGSAEVHEGGYAFNATYYLRPRRSDQVLCPACVD